ncbi:MAG: MFS transporter [Actinomycetota bacterium]|nr:MFS transporter [Actinomycetota bacterium]
MVWQALHYAVPVFWLYALLFADSGLDVGEISVLFALWSAAGIVLEVPSGALADRWSRRGALAASGPVIGAGFAAWTVWPTFTGFAAGFLLWAAGGALASGSLEALVYDGLLVAGEADAYARVNGRLEATAQLAQIPSGLAASALFELGGYALAGWVSVGICLASSIPALALRDVRPDDAELTDGDQPGWFREMSDGVTAAVRTPGLRVAVAAVAVLGGVDASEEYFPLVAEDAGIPTAAVPLALLAVPLVGALGSWGGGRLARRRWSPAVLLVLAAAGLASTVAGNVAGLAGMAVFWGAYQSVRVCVETRLQDRIRGRARATATSVASFGAELCGIALFGAWALGGAGLVAALTAACVPLLLAIRPNGLNERAGRLRNTDERVA